MTLTEEEISNKWFELTGVRLRGSALTLGAEKLKELALKLLKENKGSEANQ